MQAMFFLAVALAAAGTLVRDGSAAAGDTVMEFRALCRLATELDAFRHLGAPLLWGGQDPETQIEETLRKLAGGGGERPCAHRARAFIGGRAQQAGSGGGGVAGEACAKGSKGPERPGQAPADTLLCQAKEAKTQAEEQIKKAKILAREAAWGKESGGVEEGALQTETWADNPGPSSLAAVAKADEHCVASNVLWLCMDGLNTDTARPCFKNAAVTALGLVSSHTHSNCHVTPATALKVWEALAPLCINETAKEARPAEELATTALAAAANVIAKIHDISNSGRKFILGPQGSTASTCNKNVGEICIKFGSANNKLNEIYCDERVRSIAAAVKHANTLAAEARNLATHAKLTAAQCLATEEEASTSNSTETNEKSQTKEDQEEDNSAGEAQHGGRARRHTESNQDEARTSEKAKAQPATSQHSAATAHRQRHAEAALAILATRLARSARHE
ncbi:variant surface glycoprotein (VSG, atypical), putative [Trypanosoma vivax Y486]|uniref:Variant surface glycoprotein (VSG, atypical), putative n=1 Tax=Trypanosoma vivax (strain Y486) TaxID=1055687 RepID=F9WUX7_TRYVY|nr:variant surface glycoprotein (VSG, atypical), putative [Trypanosoma vivax Y486]|eukprot:CCD21377.1 variant surface glycoprotein (VSG, atypical), putative [Trypanosoma vivax Y486]